VELLDAVGVLIALCVVALGALGLRRQILVRRGSTVDISCRLRPGRQGRGWVLGVGRYDGDRLVWYRVFSLAPRPRRSIPRQELTIIRQRRPTGPENLSLLSGSVVLECSGRNGRVELAMSEAAVPGFQAWVEATPTVGPEIS